MANIYCWLSVESIDTGSNSSTIAYCGKEKDCVSFAESLDIFSGYAREYISRNVRWLARKSDGKFRVRVLAGGEDELKVERIFNLKAIKR